MASVLSSVRIRQRVATVGSRRRETLVLQSESKSCDCDLTSDFAAVASDTVSRHVTFGERLAPFYFEPAPPSGGQVSGVSVQALLHPFGALSILNRSPPVLCHRSPLVPPSSRSVRLKHTVKQNKDLNKVVGPY